VLVALISSEVDSVPRYEHHAGLLMLTKFIQDVIFGLLWIFVQLNAMRNIKQNQFL